MEINRKVLISLFIIGILALGIGWGTHSLFTDTETSSGNTFTAATLDLKVNGTDDPNVVYITLSNMKPGDDTGYFKWVLRNAGTLPGKVSVTFSLIVNDENGINKPEQAAESQPYASSEGELGQYLKPGIEPWSLPPGVIILERNDTEGWFIAMVEEEIDIGGSIGWGPKDWSVPSRVHSIWQTGPPNPWGVPGLNGLGGKTYGTLGYLPKDILNPGQEVAFFFRVKLQGPTEVGGVPHDPCDLMMWDGTKWVDIDDNLIQSDSVTFSITFRLEQIQP
jgi:predicted ribosomally synthesized peptide with SipW-like signal peptide